MIQKAERVETRLEVHFDDRVLKCYIERPSSLYAMLRNATERYPEREASVCGSKRLTWRELAANVANIAAGLAGKGVESGDRVAVLLGNRIEFVESVFAISMLGAVLVPLSTRDQKPGITHILNDCGAKVLIHESDMAERLPEPADVPTVTGRICVGADSVSDAFSALRSSAAPIAPATVAEEDTAAILYTSGTTGKPKGAMLSNLNIAHSAMHYELAIGLGANDRFIVAVPLSHVTGLIALLATAAQCAAALIIMPAFKAAAFLELAQQERMTYTLMVPTMYNLCLIQTDCSQFDLSNWRIGAFGGAIMPQATIDMVGKIWKNLTLLNVYGATETTSPATILPPGASGAHLDSVGKAVPCGEIAIMNDAGQQVPPGSAGELWIRGPMVVKGYWNNPAATKECFVSGFWKSGDIGSIDENGFVSVFDRKKDMINRGGFKIYSSEVENVLCQHPDVFEAAVVGKPCPVLGERVHAFVVLREVSVSELTLRAYCAERLTDYQVPESFTFSTSPLPRNANGKVLKRDLRIAPPT